MTPKKILLGAAVLAALALTAPSLSPVSATSARAQGMPPPSCYQLWHERNAIYARRGYCFKTQRARSVFGRGCFPPFGRLSPGEQSRVSRIEQMEFRMGCR